MVKQSVGIGIIFCFLLLVAGQARAMGPDDDPDFAPATPAERLSVIARIQGHVDRRFPHINVLREARTMLIFEEGMQEQIEAGQKVDHQALFDKARADSAVLPRPIGGHCGLSMQERRRLAAIVLQDGYEDRAEAHDVFTQYRGFQNWMAETLPPKPAIPTDFSLETAAELLHQARVRELFAQLGGANGYEQPFDPHEYETIPALNVHAMMTGFFYCQVIAENAGLVQAVLDRFSLADIYAHDPEALRALWFFAIHADENLDIQEAAVRRFEQWGGVTEGYANNIKLMGQRVRRNKGLASSYTGNVAPQPLTPAQKAMQQQCMQTHADNIWTMIRICGDMGALGQGS